MKRRDASALKVARERVILHAALEELASADYGSVTFEGVAERAGVNKTTVYRHWPTKAHLVTAALESSTDSAPFGPSTGSLRGDLMRVGRMMLESTTSFQGQCAMRLRLLDHAEPELAQIARAVQSRRTAALVSVLREWADRGELSPDVDPRLLVELLGGAIHARLFVTSEPVDEVVISRIVDFLLKGARGTKRGHEKTAQARRRAKSKKARA